MSSLQSLRELQDNALVFQDTASAPLPGAIVPCLLCAKPFLMRPFIGDPDQICPECWETYKDAARVVCWKCRVTICRLVPKVLDNGFYIRPKTVYHSTGCNVCQPGLKKSTIIEVDEWEKSIRPKKIIVPGSKYR